MNRPTKKSARRIKESLFREIVDAVHKPDYDARKAAVDAIVDSIKDNRTMKQLENVGR